MLIILFLGYNTKMKSVAELMDELSAVLEQLEVVIPHDGLVLKLKFNRQIFVTSTYVIY